MTPVRAARGSSVPYIFCLNELWAMVVARMPVSTPYTYPPRAITYVAILRLSVFEA